MKKLLIFVTVAIIICGGYAFALPPLPGSAGLTLKDTNCNQSKYFALGTLCQDTDDAKLYKGTGAAVEEVASASAGAGDVVGPAASAAGEVVVFDGVTGKAIKRSSGLTGWPYITAGVLSVDTAANTRTALGLAIGTNVQAYDADLTTYAGITPSANVQSFLGAANYAAMKTLMGYYTSGDTITGTLSGNASTATALASNPTDCGAGDFANAIAANGNLTCGTPAYPTAASLHLDDIITLSGVAAESVHLGTFTGSTITDNQTIKAAFQLIETAFEGLPGGHTQNTDTGTSSAVFQVDAGNSGPKLKNDSGTFAVRNAADSAWAPLKATTIEGTTITATTGFSGALSGNASTATALAANPSDCAANTFATTIGANGDLTCGAVANAATTATALNTASAIVARDGSGNFAAGTITAALSGNSSTATALASNPSDCSANQFANAIAANGNLTCAQPATSNLSDATSVAMLADDEAVTGSWSFGNADTDTFTIRSMLIGGNSRAVQIAASVATPTYATGTNELYVAGDIETAGTVYAAAFSGGAGTDGTRAVTLTSNTTFTPAGNQIYFLNNVAKLSENGTERDIVTPADSVTWTGASHSFAGVTNMILPTATPDANGEIGVNNTNETLLVYINSGLKTFDFTGDSSGYVLKSNGSGLFTLAADETGGTPALSSVGNPTADSTITMDASEEVNFDYTGNFTTGSQFKIEQKTGNPSGGGAV